VSEALTGLGGATPTASAPARAANTEATKQGEGFERMLLGQLTKVLVDGALGGDQDSSAAAATYRDQLPDVLTEALMSGGGIGLAKALQEQAA
jgi:Rod binding domain-containing protein